MACDYKIKGNPKTFSEEELKSYLLQGGLKELIDKKILKDFDVPQEFLSSQLKTKTNESNGGENENETQKSQKRQREANRQVKSESDNAKGKDQGKENASQRDGDVLAEKEGAEAKTKASSFSKKPLSLQKIKEYAKQVITGTTIFKRFSPQEQRGFIEGGVPNVEASIILGENETAGGERQSIEEQEKLIQDYAEKNGIWHKNTDTEYRKKYGRPLSELEKDGNQEATVWRKDGTTVIKAQNTAMYGFDLQNKLDGITLHNTYFPEAPLKVVGFGRDANGDFQVIVEQPFIVKAENKKITPEQIKEYLKNIGFEKEIDNNQYTDAENKTIVEDIHTGNAILTPAGNIIVIDPIMRLNTPEQGYGGTREIGQTSFEEQSEEQPPKPPSASKAGGKKPPSPPIFNDSDVTGEDPDIDNYEMTTSGEVNKFLSGQTWEDVFGENAETDQTYETQRLSDMLQDGKNMIAIAQGKWGGDVLSYGKPLFQFIQNMSNDAALTNKKAVLLATFLGELQEAKMRDPQQANEIAQLEKAVFAYYQNYMNIRGKEIVAGRLLRLYRDKYIGDLYVDKILEEEQVKAKRAFQDIEQKKEIDDKTASEAMQPITQEEKKTEDEAAKKKTEKSEKEQKKKPKMSAKEATERLKSKEQDIKDKVGDKQKLIDRIKDTINKLNCK